MICQKCGKEIPTGSKFCPYCGNAISARVTPNSNGQSPTGTPTAGEMAETAPQKKRTNLIVWGIVCVVVLLGVFWAKDNFGKTLSGRYVSESRPDTCSIVFDRDGSLLYHYRGDTLYGTYSKVNGTWVLRIEGSGLYFDNVLVAQAKGMNILAISSTSDDPDAEIFVRQPEMI